jgi:PAS domain S-box-containing protein
MLLRTDDQQELYRAVFEGNVALKLLVDPSTGDLVDVNQPACAFYGYSYEQLLGMRIFDINTAPREQVQAAMAAVRRGERSYLNAKHRLASGEVRDVDVYSGPIDIGQRTLLFSIVHDVTDRARLESQLHQSRKMEALGQLAGGVAHDFNNLLTAILGYGELIVAQTEPGSQANSAASQVVRIASRAEELTRQLLDFSRKQLLRPDVVSLNEAVRESARLLERVLGEQVELRLELSDEACDVRADPGQLELLIMNLAVNARDAMPTGGMLHIRTERLRSGRGADEVVLSVRDDGVGMTEEVRARIFEPFFTTKDKLKGTGLGLATVYSIVQQGGGQIEVESAPGRGSTFRIRLPAARKPRRLAATAPEKREGAAEGAGYTVLLVEDEQDVRDVLRQMLALRGYRVLEAKNAAEALELASGQDGEIHALVSDLRMPGMGGRELANRLAGTRPGLRTVLMSGYAEAGGAGASDVPNERAVFIQKPFRGRALAEALGRALGTV